MTLAVAFGEAQELDSRQAGAVATRRALDKIGGAPVRFGFILSSSQHNMSQVLSGVTSLLGNTPLFGFNVSNFISGQDLPRTVQVLLLAGQEIHAFADWWPDFSKMSRVALRSHFAELYLNRNDFPVLLTAQNGYDAREGVITEALLKKTHSYFGLLAVGNDLDRKTYEIGGASAGMDGLAVAVLKGNIHFHIYRAHAWEPLGIILNITNVRDLSIRTINERPAVEIYGNIFGGSSEDWMKPPLNSIVSAYPLGMEIDEGKRKLITPIKFNEDGSLRLNSLVSEGSQVNLLISNPEASLSAVHRAVVGAKNELGETAPIALFVFADQAWYHLLEGRMNLLKDIFKQTFGDLVPVFGGFTLGQFLNRSSENAPVLTQGELNILVLSK